MKISYESLRTIESASRRSKPSDAPPGEILTLTANTFRALINEKELSEVMAMRICSEQSRGTTILVERCISQIVCSETPRMSASKSWWAPARRGMSVISARVQYPLATLLPPVRTT